MKREKENVRWEQLTEREKESLIRIYPLIEILKDENETIRLAYFSFEALKADRKMLRQNQEPDPDREFMELEYPELKKSREDIIKTLEAGIEGALNFLRRLKVSKEKT